MINWLLYLSLCTAVAGMTWVDKKLYGNYFSPVAILGWPMLILLFLALALCEPLGFRPLSADVLLLYLFGLPVFWFGSLFWGVVLPRKNLEMAAKRFRQPMPILQVPLKTGMLVMAWVIIVVLLLSFFRAFGSYGSLSAMGSDEFAYAYSGSGWAGHMLVMAILTLIYLIGIARKHDYLTLATIFILIVLILLQQVKTWLYVPLVGGFLLRFYNLRRIRINPLSLILILAAVVALFFLSYYFAVGIDEGDFARKNYNIARHFLGYLFAGVLGFGEHMQRGLEVGAMPEVLFQPFTNLWHFINGEPVQGVVSKYHVWIDLKSEVDVNVKTIFGTIYVHAGLWYGLIYVFVLGLLLYLNWIMASLSRNYWIVVLYAFLAAPLALGWFDFYYNQLTFVELPVIVLLLIFLTGRRGADENLAGSKY